MLTLPHALSPQLGECQHRGNLARYGVKTVDLQTTWARNFGSLHVLVNIMTADPDLPLSGCSALIPVPTS